MVHSQVSLIYRSSWNILRKGYWKHRIYLGRTAKEIFVEVSAYIKIEENKDLFFVKIL